MGLYSRLPSTLRRFRVAPRGVIHVGAHEGQERAHYDRAGLRRQLWLEPQPEIFRRLVANLPNDPRVQAFQLACGSKPGVATMHVLEGNQGMSNSLLPPKDVLSLYQGFTEGGRFEVPVVRLDDLLRDQGLSPADYSLLALDVQGFELEVLKGASGLVEGGAAGRGVEAVISEVSEVELYAGNARLSQIDEFLEARGFRRVITRLNAKRTGDAVYVLASKLSRLQRLRLEWLGMPRR